MVKSDLAACIIDNMKVKCFTVSRKVFGQSKFKKKCQSLTKLICSVRGWLTMNGSTINSSSLLKEQPFGQPLIGSLTVPN